MGSSCSLNREATPRTLSSSLPSASSSMAPASGSLLITGRDKSRATVSTGNEHRASGGSREKRRNFVKMDVRKSNNARVAYFTRSNNMAKESTFASNKSEKGQLGRCPLSVAPVELPRALTVPTRVLPLKEYKRWLTSIRKKGRASTPVAPLINVRCKTATVRGKRLEKEIVLLGEKKGGNRKPASPSPIPKQIFINCDRTGRVSSDSEKSSGDSGVFDLMSLSHALPRNKVRPVFTNHVKPCQWNLPPVATSKSTVSLKRATTVSPPVDAKPKSEPRGGVSFDVVFDEGPKKSPLKLSPLFTKYSF